MKKQQANTSFDLTNEIKPHLLTVRGQLSLLDRDVASLYGVETRIVNQAVKNNPTKFPEGYVIELTPGEVEVLRSKFLTLDSKRLIRRVRTWF